MLVGFGDDVLAQRQRHVLGMRHRHDAGRVDRVHAVDQLKDAVELLPHFGGLGGVDLDPGEVRDALNLVSGKCHFRGL